LLLVAGLLVHRGALVALSAPLILATILFRRGRRSPTLRVDLKIDDQEVGEETVVVATITVSSDVSLELVNIELESDLVPVDGTSAWTISVLGGEATSLSIALRSGPWGRRFVGPAFATPRWNGLMSASETVESSRLPVTILATTAMPVAGELAAHAIGFAGEHRSRLLSLGTDVAGVRPFRAGDPIRRVNWHASARSPELQVTSTFGERSATVWVAIDASCDVVSPSQSSLDVSVRAAAAIAAHFLELGDSVGLAEAKHTVRLLRPASGRRHLSDARRWLSGVRVFPGGAPTNLMALPVRAGQLVIALSPIVDTGSLESLLAIRRRGCALVVVDVLPPDAIVETDDEVGYNALRLWRLERSMLIARLAELGVPVVQQAEPSSLAVALADVVRIAAGPHLIVR
jgi:uncharacterized protein (DUF58 family)